VAAAPGRLQQSSTWAAVRHVPAASKSCPILSGFALAEAVIPFTYMLVAMQKLSAAQASEARRLQSGDLAGAIELHRQIYRHFEA
jgi:hypothetical protein